MSDPEMKTVLYTSTKNINHRDGDLSWHRLGPVNLAGDPLKLSDFVPIPDPEYEVELSEDGLEALVTMTIVPDMTITSASVPWPSMERQAEWPPLLSGIVKRFVYDEANQRPQEIMMTSGTDKTFGNMATGMCIVNTVFNHFTTFNAMLIKPGHPATHHLLPHEYQSEDITQTRSVGNMRDRFCLLASGKMDNPDMVGQEHAFRKLWDGLVVHETKNELEEEIGDEIEEYSFDLPIKQDGETILVPFHLHQILPEHGDENGDRSPTSVVQSQDDEEMSRLQAFADQRISIYNNVMRGRVTVFELRGSFTLSDHVPGFSRFREGDIETSVRRYNLSDYREKMVEWQQSRGSQGEKSYVDLQDPELTPAVCMEEMSSVPQIPYRTFQVTYKIDARNFATFNAIPEIPLDVRNEVQKTLNIQPAGLSTTQIVTYTVAGIGALALFGGLGWSYINSGSKSDDGTSK